MKKQCSVEDCDKPLKGRGLCRNHYEKWRRNPDRDLREDGRRFNGPTRKPGGVTEKRCPICDEVKSADNYYRHSNGQLQAYCKPCHAERMAEQARARKAANPKPPQVYNMSLPCAFEGCRNNRVSGNWCGGHREQEKAGKEMAPLGRYDKSKIDENTRRCTTCLIISTNDDFYQRPDGTSHSRCKRCSTKISRFSDLLRQDRLQEALSLAETMPEVIREKYVGKVVDKLK